ncbi:hypothetical protein E2H86_20015 [Pseudomonas putida]|uniref:hypothetical protein n=1 Tax=Pseudomonas putida TaxID=303 RepID=UPI00105A1E99|nr:hypothetical protein [Pseudomonas putida]TDJ74443.1 hypothetical protein E2H86_20015 [Pseudomonas putida]
MKLFTQLLARLRLARWRKKLKADRGFSLRLRNPTRFLEGLARENVPYVVLRWYDEVPEVLSGQLADDIDILVQHGSLPRIAAAMPFFNFGRKANKVKFDIYSDSGRSGLSYRHMPYYPPVRARHLLDTRVHDPRGWYRIAPADYIPALTYHLTYHKRQNSGLRVQPGDSEASRLPAKKDYRQRLLLEAAREGVAIPPIDSLVQAHLWLHEQGWAMPFDLIRRWPDQDAWLAQLFELEAQRLQASSEQTPDNLFMLVTRQETADQGHEQEIIDTLSRHGTVVAREQLSGDQRQRLLWWARGGNWLAAKQYALSAPATVITCLLPTGTVADIKVELRKSLSQRHGKQNWLHGTDDLDETLYYQQLMSGHHYRLPTSSAGH